MGSVFVLLAAAFFAYNGALFQRWTGAAFAVAGAVVEACRPRDEPVKEIPCSPS